MPTGRRLKWSVETWHRAAQPPAPGCYDPSARGIDRAVESLWPGRAFAMQDARPSGAVLQGARVAVEQPPGKEVAEKYRPYHQR
jgi:hypothetical protein